jgi:5'-nucleotidase
MKFILTNDDGIDAPGLVALRAAVQGDMLVVAPKDQRSECSHQTTTREAFHVEQRDNGEYAVDGTPADCTRIALRHLAEDADLVLSGINAGGNLGADVYISGTVAAVREAAFLGKTGVAFSQFFKADEPMDWERTARWTAEVLEVLLERTRLKRAFYNVNFPHVEADAPDPEVVFCDVCTEPLPVAYEVENGHFRYKGYYPGRERTPGRDVEQCMSGKISVSVIGI